MIINFFFLLIIIVFLIFPQISKIGAISTNYPQIFQNLFKFIHVLTYWTAFLGRGVYIHAC